MRRKLTKEDKQEIGLVCCNCGSREELEYHHVVPVSLGKRILIQILYVYVIRAIKKYTMAKASMDYIVQ